MPRRQLIVNRAVKTLVYCPFEADHENESPMVAWLLIGLSITIGILASFENLWLGVGLAVVPLYAAVIIRYAISSLT